MRRRPARYGGSKDAELVIVLDCAELDRASDFWCAALRYVGPPPEWRSGSYRQLLPADGDGIELLLQQVPEGHEVKNRVHLDLRTPDMDREVARLVAIGAARQTSEALEEDGWKWHVLSDPDGNELCVLQPPLPTA